MPESRNNIPHLDVVIATTAAAILGYAAFSIWVFMAAKDASLMGDVAGTWKSFAVLAFGFWLGSSSGGKASTNEPQKVKIDNGPGEAVPVKESGNVDSN